MTERRLTDWVKHRMRLLGIQDEQGLAALSGNAEGSLARFWQTGGLKGLQRSACRRLGWALQVSLRQLDGIDSGRIDWIDDADRYSAWLGDAPCSLPASSAALPRGSHCEPPQGTPVLGRIDWTGRIEPDECWDQQLGRRLPDGRPQSPRRSCAVAGE